jgi:hypothetical protein
MKQQNDQQINQDLSESEQPELVEVADKTDETDFTKIASKKKKKLDILFKVSGKFVLIDKFGIEIESEQAKFILDEEKISILAESGKATPIFLRDIIDFWDQDYQINLLFFGGKLIISDFGYQYDDFIRVFTKIRHEIIQKDLLMKEGVRKTGFRGKYDYQELNKKCSGDTEVEIYDTGIIIKPERGDLIRIPYSEINEFSGEDYKISIITDNASIILSSFGEKFDSLNKIINQVLAELSLKTQELLREFLPDLDILTIKKVSELLKDGRAVDKNKLDEISAQIWLGLEEKLSKIGILESYQYLKSLSTIDHIFVGVKRDLMGEMTGEYLWLLLPIVSKSGDKFLVMEAGSTMEDSGKATYLFKILKDENIEELIKKFNRCMLAINFRREPIYIKDEELEKPEYLKYKIAMVKIPELKELRQLFVGRVSHTSLESWKENLDNLINNNI